MKNKIIFLDIDGVLNSQRYYENVDKLVRINSRDIYGEAFDPLSASLLNKLIDVTGAKVIISSSWRSGGLDEMKSMWIDRKMSGEVIGITPSFRMGVVSEDLLTTYRNVSIPRGIEIQWMYQTHFKFRHWNWDGPFVQEEKAKCTLESYVIFDDDSDMLYEQRNNFVHCDNMTGLMEPEYEKAYQILMNV